MVEQKANMPLLSISWDQALGCPFDVAVSLVLIIICRIEIKEIGVMDDDWERWQ